MVKDDYNSGRNQINTGNVPIMLSPGEVPFPCNGNVETMNMNPLILGNVKTTDYFKNLGQLQTMDQFIDQVYADGKMVVPWYPGTHNQVRTSGMCSQARGVSAAGVPTEFFTLLFKFFTMRPSAQQIQTIIDHPDSPYIRALGFIFLRYVCPPEHIWAWFEHYVTDEDELYLRGEKADKTPSTIGKLCRTLLTTLDFHDTMLPRLPVKVTRDIQAKLGALDLPPDEAEEPQDRGYGSSKGGYDGGARFKGSGGKGYQGSRPDGRGDRGSDDRGSYRGDDRGDRDRDEKRDDRRDRDKGDDKDSRRDSRREDKDSRRDSRRDDRGGKEDRDRDSRREDKDSRREDKDSRRDSRRDDRGGRDDRDRDRRRDDRR